MQKLLHILISLLLASGAIASAAETNDWQLIWSDEFDYEGAPDDTKWRYDHGPNWYNGELQYYTLDRRDNARVADGVLVIEAKHEDYKDGKQYTSARMLTKASWTYGKMDIRAKLTNGEGLWPAIWMLPDNDIYGTWPASGEIDIMEYWSWAPTTIFGTIHTTAFNHVNKTEKQGQIEVESPAEQFHVYSIEWYENQIRWFVDGKHYFTVDAEAGKEGYPFDNPFHLILNVAVEKHSPGKEHTWHKRTMEVDYVRVYENANSSTGTTSPDTMASNVPGLVEAENYSLAHEVKKQFDHVGYIEPNAWLNYFIDVASPNQYEISIKYASPEGSNIQYKVGDQISALVDLPATNDWGIYSTATSSITLPAGENTLTVSTPKGLLNIDSFDIQVADESTNDSTGNTDEDTSGGNDGKEPTTPVENPEENETEENTPVEETTDNPPNEEKPADVEEGSKDDTPNNSDETPKGETPSSPDDTANENDGNGPVNNPSDEAADDSANGSQNQPSTETNGANDSDDVIKVVGAFTWQMLILLWPLLVLRLCRSLKAQK